MSLVETKLLDYEWESSLAPVPQDQSAPPGTMRVKIAGTDVDSLNASYNNHAHAKFHGAGMSLDEWNDFVEFVNACNREIARLGDTSGT